MSASILIHSAYGGRFLSPVVTRSECNDYAFSSKEKPQPGEFVGGGADGVAYKRFSFGDIVTCVPIGDGWVDHFFDPDLLIDGDSYYRTGSFWSKVDRTIMSLVNAGADCGAE